MGLRRSLLGLGIACAMATGASADEPPLTEKQKLEAEIAELEEKALESPDDVDLRLKLAFRLSWGGRSREARLHAEEVLRSAPAYWDAHLLLARIDAWERGYEQAKLRIDQILTHLPNNVDALTLKADVGLWSGDFPYAEDAIRRLIAIKPSADLYFRLAQLSLESLDPLKARRLAQKALELDPEHERAKILRENTDVVKFYLTSQMEVFSAVPGEGKRAYAQTAVISLLPSSSLGVAITYDFHRRFLTDNHRLGARINFRPTDTLILTGFLRGGFAEVVPRFSADAGLTYLFDSGFNLGARYSWDKMSWPGTLHRATASLSSQITRSAMISGQYFGGLVRHCGDSDFVQGVSVRGRYTHQRFGLGLRYAFGTELERPPLPAYLQGRFSEDFCLNDINMEVSGSPLDLSETRAHDIGGALDIKLGKSTVFLAGYGIQLRFDNSEVHVMYISLQQAL